MTLLSYCPDYDTNIDTRRLLSAAFLRLTARQERVIREYFGINCPAKTLKEIAKIFDRSTERIRGIKDKALRRLRMFLRRPWKRIEVDLTGANFGIVPEPPQPRSCPYPVHWKSYFRLVGVINEMTANGASREGISARLVSDYKAATWMNQKQIWEYVPSGNAIAYIMRVGTLEY